MRHGGQALVGVHVVALESALELSRQLHCWEVEGQVLGEILAELVLEHGRREVATVRGQPEEVGRGFAELEQEAAKQVLAECQRGARAEYRRLFMGGSRNRATVCLAAEGCRRCDALVERLVGGCYRVGRLVRR